MFDAALFRLRHIASNETLSNTKDRGRAQTSFAVASDGGGFVSQGMAKEKRVTGEIWANIRAVRIANHRAALPGRTRGPYWSHEIRE